MSHVPIPADGQTAHDNSLSNPPTFGWLERVVRAGFLFALIVIIVGSFGALSHWLGHNLPPKRDLAPVNMPVQEPPVPFSLSEVFKDSENG